MALSRKKLYIAGPMRDLPLYNFPAFDAAAEAAARAGFIPVSPADLDREAGFDERKDVPSPADLRAMIIRDVIELTKCDAIALLTGWAHSSGVAVELAVAKFLGMDVLDARTFEKIEVAP